MNVRLSAVLLASALAAIPVTPPPQGRTYRAFDVQTCHVADSILGTVHPIEAVVEGYYDKETDSTFLRVGRLRTPQTYVLITASVSFPGHISPSHPDLSVSLFVPGSRGMKLLRTYQAPTLAMTVDDTLTVPLGTGYVGNYRGPSGDAIVPVSTLFFYGLFRAAAAARTGLVVTINGEPTPVDPDAIKQLRALFYAVSCPQPAIR